MIILKPENGFVVPVVYMNNDMLFNKNSETINLQKESKEIKTGSKEVMNNSLFRDDNYEVKNEEVIRNRLFEEDYEKEENNNVIESLVDKNSKLNKSGRGILVLEDDNSFEIDENKSIELEKARNNFRKAIEVEIEKVGKLVLDDEESNVDSKILLSSSEVDLNTGKANTVEKNISTNEVREQKDKEYKDNK